MMKYNALATKEFEWVIMIVEIYIFTIKAKLIQ